MFIATSTKSYGIFFQHSHIALVRKKALAHVATRKSLKTQAQKTGREHGRA